MKSSGGVMPSHRPLSEFPLPPKDIAQAASNFPSESSRSYFLLRVHPLDGVGQGASPGTRAHCNEVSRPPELSLLTAVPRTRTKVEGAKLFFRSSRGFANGARWSVRNRLGEYGYSRASTGLPEGGLSSWRNDVLPNCVLNQVGVRP